MEPPRPAEEVLPALKNTAPPDEDPSPADIATFPPAPCVDVPAERVTFPPNAVDGEAEIVRFPPLPPYDGPTESEKFPEFPRDDTPVT